MSSQQRQWLPVEAPGYEAEAAIDFARAPLSVARPSAASEPAHDVPACDQLAESGNRDRQDLGSDTAISDYPGGHSGADRDSEPGSDTHPGARVTALDLPRAGDSEESPPARPTAASLLPRQTPLDALPATWGWRGWLRRLSGGLISPQVSAEELRHRAARVAVRRSFTRPMTVVFANPKGGAGKTPATLLAGATFGSSRGGYVVAWDNNETRGTLGVRGLVPDRDSTVWNLLGELDRFERVDARAGDLAASSEASTSN